MAANIVAFVGQNENGILRHTSLALMELLRPCGIDGHVVDLTNPSWLSEFEALLRQGVLMAWGQAGIGARAQLDGKNLWDLIKVPFVSVLGDSPCWMPNNHCVQSRYVVNAYVYSEWLKVQRRFVRSEQICALLTYGVIPNPERDRLAWSDRPRRMVLVKTGADPEDRRDSWKRMPRRTRAVIEDAASVAASRGPEDITDIVLDCFDAHGVCLEGRPEILFGLMREVDNYVRDLRSTTLVRALLDLPVEIFGRGWDHLSGFSKRAVFRSAIDAQELSSLYAETQFLLNTTPNFSSGLHERIPYGFDAKCCVVSDENDYMRAHLKDIPTFFSLDLNAASLADRLGDIYADPTDYSDMMEPARELVERDFSGVRYMSEIVELAMEVKLGEHFTEAAPN